MDEFHAPRVVEVVGDTTGVAAAATATAAADNDMVEG